jgi:hypothetical protein
MNRIEKTATFVVALVAALAITLLGATFATAPLALTGLHGSGGVPSALSAQL